VTPPCALCAIVNNVLLACLLMCGCGKKSSKVAAEGADLHRCSFLIHVVCIKRLRRMQHMHCSRLPATAQGSRYCGFQRSTL